MDWLKNLLGQVAHSGAAYLRHAAVIEQLLQMDPASALQALQLHVAGLDEQSYQEFIATAVTLAGEQYQAAQQGAQYDGSWGSSYEDQMAYYAARIQSGESYAPQGAGADERLQSLIALVAYAEQFRAQRPAGALDSDTAEGDLSWSSQMLSADLALHEGRTEEAAQIYQSCLDSARADEKPARMLRCFDGLARVAQKLGDRQAERRWVEEGLKLPGVEAEPLRGSLLRSGAMLLFEEGHLSLAADRLTELIQAGAPEAPESLYEYCNALSDRATVYRWSGRWSEALADVAEAERLATRLDGLQGRAIMHHVQAHRVKLYGSPLSTAHDPAKARAALAAIRPLAMEEWIPLELEAGLALLESRWSEAAAGYLRVAETLERNGWAGGAARSRLAAGRALLEAGEFGRASAEFEAVRPYMERFGPPDVAAALQTARARLLSSQGEYEEAWQLICQAFSGVESLIRHFRSLFDQQKFIREKLVYYQHAFAIGLGSPGSKGILRAWSVAERAKSFYLCQLVANGEVPLFEGVDPAKIARLKTLEVELDRCELALAASDHPPAEIREQMGRASKERAGLLAELMKENPRWAGLRTPPELDLPAEVSRLTRASWTPLCYFWEGSRLHQFWVGPDGEPCHDASDWPKEELDALDACHRRLVGTLSAAADILPAGAADRLLPPALAALARSGRRLLISPHGPLHGLPLHAVPLGNDELLIDRCPVQYIPTLGLLPLQREAESPREVLLLGCEQDSLGGAHLPEVPGEIARLSQIWREARPDSVRAELLPARGSPADSGLPVSAWERFGLLHIACHGHFPEGAPLDASLRLGREALRVSELFTVRLRADLVCLSACDLGRQERRAPGEIPGGDEWLGAYLPLFYAGARAMLVSLWEANSEVAALFMDSLHTAMRDGAPAEEAFFCAIRRVRQKPDPFWANWYLVGFPIISQNGEERQMAKNVFEIELPPDLSEAERAALQEELRSLTEVQDAGSTVTRGIDAETAMLWVKVATSAISVAGTAMPIIERIADLFRRRGVTGAQIKMADGSVVKVDGKAPAAPPPAPSAPAPAPQERRFCTSCGGRIEAHHKFCGSCGARLE